MRLICLGDIALSELAPPLSGTWRRPLSHLAEDGPSCILFNWEFPCAEARVENARLSGSLRRYISPPAAVGFLQEWVPAVAALANNHLMDGGIAGVFQTVNTLSQVGICTFGGGASPDQILNPWIWETNDGRVGVLNWVTPETHPDPPGASGVGPNLWPGENDAANQIRVLCKSVDWVVVYLHWSDELFSYPRPQDRVLARKLISWGADVVIGNHPHVVRGAELIDNKPVFYSLGNYFFSDVRVPSTDSVRKQVRRNREALVIELNFRYGEQPSWNIYSYWRGETETRPDSKERAARRLKQVSRPLSFDNYDIWYKRSRARFERWGYRLNFRLPEVGYRGLARWLMKRSKNY